MQIKRFISAAIFSLACMLPGVAAASMYGYGYGEGPYYAYAYGQVTYYAYGQVTYYGQLTYQTTFTKNAFELVNYRADGGLTKSSGTFAIDHPLDPKNKILFHSFVESPDVKNMYDGTITLDSRGEAVVMLPAYFDALNKDVRYQLKPIGAPMPNLHVKTEEKDNRFEIGGGVPRGKVSWQVTGIRHDPYIVANPIVPEVMKGPGQLALRGEYLYAKGFPESVYSYALPSIWQPIQPQ